MGCLIVSPNIRDTDEIYARLVALHEGRTAEESLRINARLILALVNHIGDRDIIFEAAALAEGRRTI